MIRFIRTHSHDLPLPARHSEQAAGFDICAAESLTLAPGERQLVKTGWSWDTSDADFRHLYGRIAPRSGLAVKHGIDVLAGVVDADYTGEIRVALINLGQQPFAVSRGERIAQLIIEQHLPLQAEEAAAHSVQTTRGAGGFGSTGR